MPILSLDLSLSGWHSAFGGISIDTFLAAMGLTGSNAGASFEAAKYWLPSLYDSTKPVECREDDWFAQFQRASSGTGIDANGGVVDYATNKPRFIYDGGKRYLSLNWGTANLLTYSNDFANAAWLKNNCTVAGNIVTGTGQFAYPQQTKTISANTVYTISAKIKYINQSSVSFVVNDGSNNIVARFDIQNGIKNAYGIVGSALTYINHKITPLANGYYQIELSFSSTQTSAVCQLWFGQYDGIYYNGKQYALDYMQLEQSSFATPYIPTSGGAVARATDKCRLPAAMEGVLNAMQGSVLLRGKLTTTTPWSRVLGGGTVTEDGIQVSSVITQAVSCSSSGNPAPPAYANFGSGNWSKFSVAHAHDATGRRLTANGGAVGTALPPKLDLTQSYLGRDSFGCSADGLYSLIAAYPTKLSDAALQNLSGNLSW